MNLLRRRTRTRDDCACRLGFETCHDQLFADLLVVRARHVNSEGGRRRYVSSPLDILRRLRVVARNEENGGSGFAMRQ